MFVCSGAAAATVAVAPVDAANETSATSAQNATNARVAANATLVGAYPNPVADGDPGEFVLVRFDGPTDVGRWTLADGQTTVRLPNRTHEGTIAFATDPPAARRNTDRRVEPLAGRLLLADSGDRLELRRDGDPVDAARYRNVAESRVRDFEAGEWRPVGATDLGPVRSDGGEATVFVLPDGDRVTPKTLRSADERLLLAGDTLTSERVAEALMAAHRSGADVRVLQEGSPVGGVTEPQA